MMRRIMIVLVSLMVTPCFAQDADVAKRAKVEEMLVSMHADASFTRIIDIVKTQLQDSMSQLSSKEAMSAAQKKVCDKFQSDAMNLALSSVSWTAMKPEMVKLYMKNFTKQQIDDITVFYKSPTGQALLEKTPVLTGQVMQFTQARTAELQPKMTALTEQFIKDMDAASTKKTATPPKARS